MALIRKFLDGPAVAHTCRRCSGDSNEERLTPAEYKFPQVGNPGTGSSGVGGIQTVVLKGNPDQAGVYTIMLRVPAHTQIAAHSHRDDRVATVISGTWHIGYGDKFDEAKLKALPPAVFTPNRPLGITSRRPVTNRLSFRLPASVHLRPSTWMPRRIPANQPSQIESSIRGEIRANGQKGQHFPTNEGDQRVRAIKAQKPQSRTGWSGFLCVELGRLILFRSA